MFKQGYLQTILPYCALMMTACLMYRDILSKAKTRGEQQMFKPEGYFMCSIYIIVVQMITS